ncbi:MAG: phosphoribosylformylglycinamidine cyclo-ligase [Halobacteriales archaeon]
MTEDEEGLTYAEAGVDIGASEAATEALIEAVGAGVVGDYAGHLEVDGLRVGLTTDGVGTKLLVAEALGRHDTIGIDCVAMNVNDLVAEGLRPVGFVDYLALAAPDEGLTEAIGVGLAEGARRAGVALLGGETAVMPEVIDTLDLAGAAVGVAPSHEHRPGTASVGDVLVGIPASGIHSNGLTLARRAIEGSYAYDEPFPPDPDRTIGEELLEPTRIYTPVVHAIRRFDVSACAHVTGGGFTNLARMGANRYVIDDPLPIPEIFRFVADCGNVAEVELYRTFNMGMGFALAVAPGDAAEVAEALDGQIVGAVEAGEGIVVEDLEIPDHSG